MNKDTRLTLEVLVDYSLCSSVTDCKNNLHHRFIRSTESNEDASFPVNLQFDNGIEVKTNIISHVSDSATVKGIHSIAILFILFYYFSS